MPPCSHRRKLKSAWVQFPMKAALRSVWQENEVRLPGYSLAIGVLLAMLAGSLGFLPDSLGWLAGSH